MEQRVLYVERELAALAIREEGVYEHLLALEAIDSRMQGLVFKMIRTLLTHSTQDDLIWQLISSFLFTRGSRVSGGGTGV